MIQGIKRRLHDMLPLGMRVRISYYKNHGSLPDVRNPRTFSEMIQRRKLRDRDPRLPLFADKVLVKAFVEQTLGSEWIIPTLWYGPKLPPLEERTWPVPFVVKANHGSGANYFVKEKHTVDWPGIERDLNYHLSRKFGIAHGEWLYGDIKPQALVEPLIGDGETAPIDYKIWVFNGRAEMIQIDTDREVAHKRCFYSRDWVKLPFGLEVPRESREIDRPATLADMIAGAEKLGDGFEFVRVDFYEVDGQALFGEMTFYPGSGNDVFSDKSVDLRLGDLWKSSKAVAHGA